MSQYPNRDSQRKYQEEERNGRKHSSPPAIDKRNWGSRTVALFDKLEQVGEGTYGKVYKAKNQKTGDIVALKKIRMDNEKEGFPITAIREIKILKELNHTNIINLKEIVTEKTSTEKDGPGSIYLVFEYMDHDLAGLIESPFIKQLQPRHIKCYVRQLLLGLHYLHRNNVLHRDIKASNLLINNVGELKLADFGLARPISAKGGNYTNNVITLWYRPPELLLGSHNYKDSVDCWSTGCILAELINKVPLFPGKNEIDQLDLIWRLCGTPTKETWPDAEKLPLYKKFSFKVHQNNFQKKMEQMGITKDAFELIQGLITLDPKKRLTAEQALDADYFWKQPLPCEPSDIPVCAISSHEYTAKKRNKERREKRRHESANGYDPRSNYNHAAPRRSSNDNRHHPYRPSERGNRGRPYGGQSRRSDDQRRHQGYSSRGAHGNGSRERDHYSRGGSRSGPPNDRYRGRDDGYKRDSYSGDYHGSRGSNAPRRGPAPQRQPRGPEPQRQPRGPQPQPQRYAKPSH